MRQCRQTDRLPECRRSRVHLAEKHRNESVQVSGAVAATGEDLDLTLGQFMYFTMGPFAFLHLTADGSLPTHFIAVARIENAQWMSVCLHRILSLRSMHQ